MNVKNSDTDVLKIALVPAFFMTVTAGSLLLLALNIGSAVAG